MATDSLRLILEHHSAQACANYAEWLLWKGGGPALLPGSNEPLTAQDLHQRSAKLVRRVVDKITAPGFKPGHVPARLVRSSASCREYAAWLIEFVEMLGWAAGLRNDPPAHDVRTEPWGQTIARVQMTDGPIVGVSYAPWLHKGKENE